MIKYFLVVGLGPSDLGYDTQQSVFMLDKLCKQDYN